MKMRQVIRLNEAQLKRMVAEAVKRVLNEGVVEPLDEYEDWKAQMLHSYKRAPQAGNYVPYPDVDQNRELKAWKMAQDKYNRKGMSDNGLEYNNRIDVNANGGYMNSDEYQNVQGTQRKNRVSHDANFDLKQGVTSNSGSDINGQVNGWQNYNKYGFGTPEASQFQHEAGTDLADFYSGNYTNRMRAKASQLGNAKSGQDFRPNALR